MNDLYTQQPVFLYGRAGLGIRWNLWHAYAYTLYMCTSISVYTRCPWLECWECGPQRIRKIKDKTGFGNRDVRGSMKTAKAFYCILVQWGKKGRNCETSFEPEFLLDRYLIADRFSYAHTSTPNISLTPKIEWRMSTPQSEVFCSWNAYWYWIIA